nr:transcriptional regulator [Methylonatrum kenyense]
MLTVVSESILEDRLIDEIRELGATGYTVTDARGWGKHGKRRGKWQQDSNVQIQVVGPRELCEAICARFKEEYQTDFGLLLLISPVEVKN